MRRHVQLAVLADHVTGAKTLDALSGQHVECCDRCRSDLRWLEQVGALRQFEPPKSAVEAVIENFRRKKFEAA
jgi:hypothetical protein